MPDAYDVRVGDQPYVFNPEWDLKNDYRMRSMLSLPIRDGRGDVVGVLQLINARDEAGALAPFSAAAEDAVGALLVGWAQRPGPALRRLRRRAERRGLWSPNTPPA